MTRAASAEQMWRADVAAAQSVKYARPLVKKPHQFFPNNTGEATLCFLLACVIACEVAALVWAIWGRS